MTEKRGLASKSKNSFNNSKIFILAILSILMFAASVSYAIAANDASGAIQLTVSPPNKIANGTGTLGTGDTFYFSDVRTMNETIWLVFNVTFPEVAKFNASTTNITVNCSGVGDTRTILRNASVSQQPASGAQTDNYMVRYVANCTAVFNQTNTFYPGTVNITIYNQSGEIVNNSIATGIVIYNMSLPPPAPNGCMQWGIETTNFSTINDFERVNFKLQMLGNISCFTATGGAGSGGAEILPPVGCPAAICGWMRTFSAVNMLNFSLINLTNGSTYNILSQLPNAIAINVPPPNSRYAAATTKVWFNSTFFAGLNTNATITLYRIPFKGKPDIVTDSGAANNTEISLAESGDGVSYNLTFRVFSFSTYNASDVTAPIIASQYPTNATSIASFNPRLNFTLNGTASEVNISTLTVLFFGTNISNVSLTYLNFTCTNETSDGTIGSYMACLLNQSMANANITTKNGTYSAKVVVEDMGGDAGIKGNYTLTFASTTMLPTGVTFNHPRSKQYVNTTPTINFTINYNTTLTGSGSINASSITVIFNDAIKNRTLNSSNNISLIRTISLADGSVQVIINMTNDIAAAAPHINSFLNSSLNMSVIAQDSAGNRMAAWVSIIFYADDKKPDLRLVNTPLWSNTSSNTPNFNISLFDSVSENMTCKLIIDGALNKTQVFTNGSATYLFTPTSKLSDGIHNWAVNCTDVMGNLNATSPELSAWNITIDTAAPILNVTLYDVRVGGYFKNLWAVYKFNITDSPYNSNDNTSLSDSLIDVRCYINGALRDNVAIRAAKNASKEGTNDYQVQGNCTAGEVQSQSDGDRISVRVLANDSAMNDLVTEINFTLDSLAPAITSPPKISKTNLTQGENITFYVTIIDAVSGVNTTNATVFIDGLYGACTNISNFTRTLALVSGSNYSFQYNTSELAQGNYSLKGSVFATDFVLDGTNLNTTILGKTTSLNFTITDSGNPIINKFEINVTAFLINSTAMINITVNATDPQNISAVWANFSARPQDRVPLRMLKDALNVGGVYINNSYNFNVTTSTADMTVTIYANDTLNNIQYETRTLTVRANASVIDLFTVTPSIAYQYQSPINVSAVVFSYYGTPRFDVNITGPASQQILQAGLMNVSCGVKNASAFLYSCSNITNIGAANITNMTGLYNVVVVRMMSGDVAAANVTTNYTVSQQGNLTFGNIPAEVTVKFLEAGTTATSQRSVQIPNTTQTVFINSTPGIGLTSYLSGVNMSKVINFSINLRNNSILNTLNQTNTTTVGNSTNLGSYINDSSAVKVVIAFEPASFNATLTLGTTNNVTIFCSELGISNCSKMTLYKATFNFTTNTTGTSWTILNRTYNTANNSLTAAVSSFSIFAVAQPVECTNNGATGTTAVPSTGCMYNENVYTTGYICSGVHQSTVCYTAPAATTTATTTSTSSSDAPIGNITPTTKSTYLLGTISSGVERTVLINLAGVPVTSIAITTNKEALNTELQIQQLTSAPTDAGNVPSKVYAYTSVTPKNLAPEIITTAKMSFSVPKSWMTENGITEDQIVLSRYADGKWNELETAILSSDDTTTKYQAITPGFSYFAVTIRSAPLIAPEEQTEVPTKPAEKEETPVEQPPAEEQPPVKESKSWIAWLIAALVVVAGVAGYFIYRNMSEK